jgi:hypothetical protein
MYVSKLEIRFLFLLITACKTKNKQKHKYRRHHELVERYDISISQMTRRLLYLSMSNTAGVLLETGTVYPS